MEHRKNGFLSFIFGCIPGAGIMYMGCMKKGASILTLFSIILALSGFLRINFILFLLPVIWFYSFFDTFNLRNMTLEERLLTENKFIETCNKAFGKDFSVFFKGREKIWGVALIIFGIYVAIDNVIRYILYRFDLYFISDILHIIPDVVIAFLLVYFGIKLVKKDKINTLEKKDFEEYKNESSEN